VEQRDSMTAAEWRQLQGLAPPGADLEEGRNSIRRNLPLSGSSPGCIPEHLRPQRGKMNKTEAAYATYLDALRLTGAVKCWRFEAITLKLADGVRYTPDFLVELFVPPLEVHEVKGFWREDARVKFKVAAELFSMFRFVAVKRKNRRWEIC
jgi:hypothetical protein